MKQIMLCIVMLLMSGIAMGQQPTKSAASNGVKVEKIDAKTFRAIKTSSSKEEYKATGYFYEVKGEKYEIYIHTISRGDNAGQKACYIKRVSKKTGKEYWQKINVKPEELSK